MREVLWKEGDQEKNFDSQGESEQRSKQVHKDDLSATSPQFPYPTVECNVTLCCRRLLRQTVIIPEFVRTTTFNIDKRFESHMRLHGNAVICLTIPFFQAGAGNTEYDW